MAPSPAELSRSELLGTYTSNFYYAFPNGFTVAAGGTMTVGANVPAIQVDATLTDAGNVTFTTGNELELYYTSFSVTGSLTANGTNFLSTGGGSYITFGSAATLSGGANTFNLAINVPYTLVPSLAAIPASMRSRSKMAPSPAEPSRSDLLGTYTSNFYYAFPNGFTVAAGGTMTVGANVPAIQVDATLTDAGNVTFTTGNELELYYTSFSVTGSLTANGTNFLSTGGGSTITFGSAATLSGGANTFNLAISVPYTLVPSLAGNTSFDEVAIENGTISSGTLSLGVLGTYTSNFYYAFPNGFTVAAGGTMTVGANVPAIQVDATLTDAGNVTFTTGNELELYYTSFSVTGSLTANGTNFLSTGGGSTITFGSAATLGGGTNTFNLGISVPYTLVPSLAGNTSFEEVAIENGTISSGTLALNLLGTDTSTFYYEIPNGFTVGAGGTMTVGANVPPIQLSSSTLSDAGIVTFTSGDQLSLYYSTFSVSGSLTANGTNFLNTGGGSTIVVNSGGNLAASDSTFNVQQLEPDVRLDRQPPVCGL